MSTAIRRRSRTLGLVPGTAPLHYIRIRKLRGLDRGGSLDGRPQVSGVLRSSIAVAEVRDRDSLIQNGLIWSPKRGQVDFTVKLFAELLRENHPLASFNDA